MKKKKMMALLCAMALTTGCLYGCGQSDGGSVQTDTGAGTAAASDTGSVG